MKLLIKDYLASLRERDELDAVLPDLLSELGFTVYSRPSRGTRQYGVDMAAVGDDEDGTRKVFLFSIKAGDLKRADWDGSGPQSLRPSLNEIRDAYIRSRIPSKYANVPVAVCLCFGGDIDEGVGELVRGYMKENQTEKIEYQEWNGDKIAGLLLTGVLREELLPKHARSFFRKSVAMLDEPDASYSYFCGLLRLLISECKATRKAKLTVVRQINICLWILFVWSREAGNLESPYRSSEFAVLNAWPLAVQFFKKRSTLTQAMHDAMEKLIRLHVTIAYSYVKERIFPHATKRHGLSAAVNSATSIDVNLALFEVLGRASLCGLWLQYLWGQQKDPSAEDTERMRAENSRFINGLASLVNNNPVLVTPIKDEQAIDINLACLLFCAEGQFRFVSQWMRQITGAVIFAFKTHDKYPCVFTDYRDLLQHPKERTDTYRKKATEASVLYPTLAVWTVLVHADETLTNLRDFTKSELQHSTLQLWYPAEDSEDHLYTNDELHGAALTDLKIDRDEFIDHVFKECEGNPGFAHLTAVEFGVWPLVLMACRHYRLPAPPQFWLQFWDRAIDPMPK